VRDARDRGDAGRRFVESSFAGSRLATVLIAPRRRGRVGCHLGEDSVVRIVRGSIVLGILLIASACVIVPAPVDVPPPAALPAVEQVPVSPGPAYVWVPGYYA
jgi:hypothetical protein